MIGRSVGTRFDDRFRLLSVLGQGAMGHVYEVADEKLQGVRWALKELDLGVVLEKEKDEAIALFNQEIDILSQVSHPGCPRVIHKFTTDKGAPAFVMTRVEGTPLDILLEEVDRPLSLHETLPILLQVCHILEHLHAQNPPIIFRDLKPSNLMLTDTGTVVLIDFGIARIDDQAAVRADTLATMPGQVLGTVPFMAPEQIDTGSEEVDVRTDEYSFGVVAYLLLGGRMPYELADCGLVEAAKRIRTIEPGSLRRHAPEVDRDLDQIVRKMLAKSPDDRYRSFEVVDLEFESWSRGRPVQARPIGMPARIWRLSRRNPLLASLVVTTMLAVIATVIVLAVMLDRETGLRKIATSAAAEANLASAISAHAVGARPTAGHQRDA